MSDIKLLIDYLNPRKHEGKMVGREEFHLIQVNQTYIDEGQNLNSENLTKIILNEAPKRYIFNDAYVLLSTSYPMYVDDSGIEIKYYFRRTLDTGVDYVSLEDFLLSNTNESHFQELDDENFTLVEGTYYYHHFQKVVYIVVKVLPEMVIFGHTTLKYNSKELGGLENGRYEVNYIDATGYTNSLKDFYKSRLFDNAPLTASLKRKIELKLNPKKGKLYWYPKLEMQEGKIVLKYKYHPIKNDDSNLRYEDFAIQIKFDHVEGFLGFMVVTYFVNGISPLEISEDTNFVKADCFKAYVKIINTLLKDSKTSIDEALTYLYYIPADFFIKEQTLFSKMKDGDNILGAQFIWDIIGLALKDPLTNFGTNKEDIVLRLLKILKHIQKDEDLTSREKNDYILNQLLSRKTTDKLSYLHALYDKLNTNNFVEFNTYIYKLWRQSSFIHPDNKVYANTSPLPGEEDKTQTNNDKPRLVFPYKTNKLLGFYSSNINAKFNDVGNIIVTPDDSWLGEITTVLIGKGMGDIVEQFSEDDWEAEYHPLQPIYLADPYGDKAMQLQKFCPMLLLKGNEDKSFWSNVSTTAEYAFDAITTISGIGNLAKFRHLARAVQVAQRINKGNKVIWYYKAAKTIKGAAAAVEITSGTVNALLKITGIKDTEFGAALSEYLFWLELLSLSGEFTLAIEKGLRRNAKALTNTENLKHLDEGLDDLVKKGEIDEIGKAKVVDELEGLAKVGVKHAKKLSNEGSAILKKWTDNAKLAYSKRQRPAAVSVLELDGKRVFAYSNKSGLKEFELPKGLHPLVKKWLKEAPDTLRKRPTHGKCAEPAAISKWLWEVDPKGIFNIKRAKKEFEGVVSQARQINKEKPVRHNVLKEACDSCNPLLKHFNIIEVFN